MKGEHIDQDCPQGHLPLDNSRKIRGVGRGENYQVAVGQRRTEGGKGNGQEREREGGRCFAPPPDTGPAKAEGDEGFYNRMRSGAASPDKKHPHPPRAWQHPPTAPAPLPRANKALESPMHQVFDPGSRGGGVIAGNTNAWRARHRAGNASCGVGGRFVRGMGSTCDASRRRPFMRFRYKWGAVLNRACFSAFAMRCCQFGFWMHCVICLLSRSIACVDVGLGLHRGPRV